VITGEVKVNGQDVVTWKAVNIGQALEPGWSLYKVRARGFYNGIGYNREFTVPHERNLGLYVLTSIIMVEIGIQMEGLSGGANS
jgi:hypothetical protein